MEINLYVDDNVRENILKKYSGKDFNVCKKDSNFAENLINEIRGYNGKTN